MSGSFFSFSFFPSLSLSLSLSLYAAFQSLPRRSRSNCRERFARNALCRDARSKRTTDGVKKSVKRIRDAPNYIIDFASNTRASADRFCIFISVRADDPALPLFSLSHFLSFLSLSLSLSLSFLPRSLWRNHSLIDKALNKDHWKLF